MLLTPLVIIVFIMISFRSTPKTSDYKSTRRSKIISRASAMSIEHLLCATIPKIAFVIVLKDACLKEISCNCNHTEIGVSLSTVKVSYWK